MKVEEIETIIQKVVQRILTQEPKKTAYKVGTLACPEQTLATISKEVADIYWSDPQTETCNALLVNQLTLSQLAAISELQKTDKITSFVIDYLLAAKTVYLVTPPAVLQQKKGQKKYKLWQKIQDLWEQCQSYGLVWLSEPSLLAIHDKNSARQNALYGKPRFITENELRKMYENKQVELTEKDRLTPLAYDFAKEHQLLE